MLAALALAVLSVPFGPTGARAIGVGVSAFGTLDTHRMSQWNAVIDELRASGDAFEPVARGHSLGAGPQFFLGRGFGLSACYERLTPSPRSGARGRTLELSANAMLVSLELTHRAGRSTRVGVGGGFGYYQLGDEVEVSPGGANMEGGSLGYHAFPLLLERTLSPAVRATFALGYRSASVGVDAIDHRPPGRPVEVDYSGLTLRIGFLFGTTLR